MEEEREHAQLNEEKWDLVAETYDKLINRLWFRFTQKQVLSLLNLQENQCFLDIGCGTGWAVCYAANTIISTDYLMVQSTQHKAGAYSRAHTPIYRAG